MPEVVIIGGGCMGASVAFHLAQRGVTDVVLFEREPQLGLGSTGRNAGGVRHQFSHPANVRLSIESIRMLEEFEAITGTPVDLYQDGYLFLLSDDTHVETFRQASAMQRALGVPVDWLTPAEAQAVAPGIGIEGVQAATFGARDGISDPAGVTAGFAAAARRAGVEIRRGVEVTGIRVEHGRVVAVRTAAGDVPARVVVNAAGPWAAEVGAMAGVTLRVSPLRRHIFLAGPPSGGWASGGPSGSAAAPSSRVLVIDFATSFYFHREGVNVLFGQGDPDECPGTDTSVNWSLLERIQPVAARRLPALVDAPIVRAWAGLYEMTPDCMPVIGASGPDGCYTIAGFSGHGFQHAPAAGRLLADVIAGGDPGFDLSPFAFDRDYAHPEAGLV